MTPHQAFLLLPQDLLAPASPEASGLLWRKGNSRLEYYISLSRRPLAVFSFTFAPTHTSLSARLALLWAVIKYFSVGLRHPGERREMETNGARMDTGLKRQEWKEVKWLRDYVKWQSLLDYHFFNWDALFKTILYLNKEEMLSTNVFLLFDHHY